LIHSAQVIERITKPKVFKRRRSRCRSIDPASEVHSGYRIEATNQDKAVVPLDRGADFPWAETTITIAITITIPADHAGLQRIRMKTRSIAYAIQV
jgi:hypothetical protein